MSHIKNISGFLQMGSAGLIENEIKQAIEEGIGAKDILDDGLLDGMGKLGAKFKRNEVYVPEVLIAARAFGKGIDILRPYLIDLGVMPVGKAVLATVMGGQYDLGKNLVKITLEGAGFEVIDLGSDIPGEKIVEAVREHKPNIVAFSALPRAAMSDQGEMIKVLKEAGLRESVRVMVGGVPVTQAFCDSIGTGAYTSDAANYADVSRSFI